MQDVERMITVLSQQLVDLRKNVKGNQTMLVNGFDSVHNENDEIKEQIKLVEQKLNKLIGDVSVVNEQGKLKKDYKDYTDEEVLAIRNRLSINKAANYLHCSRSTLMRICNRARLKQFKKQEDNKLVNDEIIDF